MKSSNLHLWLVTSLCLTGAIGAKPSLFQDGPISVEIRNYPLSVPNNTTEPYNFGLSVLGLEEDGRFVPFLAIALQYEKPGADSWMAVWNLSAGGPGVLANVKALVPNLWSPARGEGTKQQPLGKLPKPVLSIDRLRAGSWKEAGWAAVETINRFSILIRPARFLVHNYTHYRDEQRESLFHQTYALLRLYEEVCAIAPDPQSLSATALTDLKFHLILSQSEFGLFPEEGNAGEVVRHFEGRLREKVSAVAARASTIANDLHLGMVEIRYGLQERPPISRGAMLYVRGTDLPKNPPPWPRNNFFDLTCNPHEDPRVRELADKNPEERIPLAIYVLGSTYRQKPVLVVDFFDPGNPKKKRATGVLKLALDHLLSVRKLPIPARVAHKAAEYSIARKDFSSFSKASAAQGLETTRLFARMGWNFDPDINRLLLDSIESRKGNPLAESFSKEQKNLERNFEALLEDGSENLRKYLRRLYEERIRKELALGRKAVFATDLNRYREEQEYQRALDILRGFNTEPHVSGQDWDRLLDAWDCVMRREGRTRRPEAARFLARLEEILPYWIPDENSNRIRQILQHSTALASSHEDDAGAIRHP